MAASQQHLFLVEENKVLRHRNRKSHNQYFTPEFVVEKAFSFIPERKIENIIDPAVGNRVFFKTALKRWGKAKLFGIDIDNSVIKNLKEMGIPNSFYFISNSLLKKTLSNPEIKKIQS